MNILIMGARSGIGLAAVRAALAQGHTVRAFSRAADRIDIDDPRLEKRPGDACKTDDVASALDSIDTVIQTLGIAAGPERIFKPVRLFSTATRVLLPEMERANVRRLITVTGFGAGDSAGRIGLVQSVPFRLLLGHAYDDKSIQERLIRDSGLDWTIARPVILTNGPATGNFHVLADPETWRWGVISRADVGDFLVAQIEDRQYIGEAVVLTT